MTIDKEKLLVWFCAVYFIMVCMVSWHLSTQKNDIRNIQTILENHDFLITHGQNRLLEHENDSLENENGVLKDVVELLEHLKQKAPE